MVKDLSQAFIRYSRNTGNKIELLEERTGTTYLTAPAGLYQYLTQFSGQYVIQRIPPTEKKGRRHTSVLTVTVLQIEESDADLQLNDVRIDTFRSGGPGGQGVNKVESGVRVVHLPTGLTVEINARDQFKNKMIALGILEQRLQALKSSELSTRKQESRYAQVALNNRGGRAFKLDFMRNRVHNEQTGLSGDLRKFMKGCLEELCGEARSNSEVECQVEKIRL